MFLGVEFRFRELLPKESFWNAKKKSDTLFNTATKHPDWLECRSF